jgi:hypothetical protein
VNPGAKRLHDLHLQQAQQAEQVDDQRRAEHHRRCALTFTFPIGDLIALTYN